MGQYYKIVNLTKREYLNPHDFNCGAKMLEWHGTLVTAALVSMLAPSDGQGGGDIGAEKIAGRWAGDAIVVAGDYGPTLGELATRYGGHVFPDTDKEETLYRYASENMKNISKIALEGLADTDEYDLAAKVALGGLPIR